MNKLLANITKTRNAIQATEKEIDQVGEKTNQLRAQIVDMKERVHLKNLIARAMKLEILRVSLLASDVLGRNEFFSNLDALMSADPRIIRMISDHAASRAKLERFNENSRWFSGRLGQ